MMKCVGAGQRGARLSSHNIFQADAASRVHRRFDETLRNVRTSWSPPPGPIASRATTSTSEVGQWVVAAVRQHACKKLLHSQARILGSHVWLILPGCRLLLSTQTSGTRVECAARPTRPGRSVNSTGLHFERIVLSRRWVRRSDAPHHGRPQMCRWVTRLRRRATFRGRWTRAERIRSGPHSFRASCLAVDVTVGRIDLLLEIRRRDEELALRGISSRPPRSLTLPMLADDIPDHTVEAFHSGRDPGNPRQVGHGPRRPRAGGQRAGHVSNWIRV